MRGLVAALVVLAAGTWWQGGRTGKPESPARRNPPASSGPGALPRVTARENEVRASTKEVERLAACYAGGCTFPETDALSYESALGQALAQALLSLAGEARRDSAGNPRLAALAREQLGNADGHVQEAALKLLATQPPREETLSAVLTDVIGGFDENLVEPALREIRRYPGFADDPAVVAALSDAMLSGSPRVGRAIAERIADFLTPENEAAYGRLVDQLPPGSVYRLALEEALTKRHTH